MIKCSVIITKKYYHFGDDLHQCLKFGDDCLETGIIIFLAVIQNVL